MSNKLIFGTAVMRFSDSRNDSYHCPEDTVTSLFNAPMLMHLRTKTMKVLMYVRACAPEIGSDNRTYLFL